MIFDSSSAIGGVPDSGASFLNSDFLLTALAFFSFFGAARRGFFLPTFDAWSLAAPEATRLDDALRPALRPVGFERLAAPPDPCFFSPTACPISLRPEAAFCQANP